MHSVTLYHWEPNANSGKPMLALMEKGVAFNSHYLDLLKFDQHRPEYLAVNPQGTIPAMVHGDRVLTESTAIMEYVDEAFPGPKLMPGDPRDRWRGRLSLRRLERRAENQPLGLRKKPMAVKLYTAATPNGWKTIEQAKQTGPKMLARRAAA